MKGFAIPLSGVIFVTLISGSIQSIYADHLEPDQGIFSSEDEIEFVTTEDSNYKIYLQAVLRNGDGQLISVVESTVYGTIIPHKITDHVFDTLMGEKEIIIIDDVKYEKVQYIFNPTLEHRWLNFYPIFSERTLNYETTADPDEKMNKETIDHSVWKIDYCADFSTIGHGFECIPIFQDPVPTMTIEPSDVVTHHWTVLRELS
jgi:hypothetical protein